LTFLASVSKYVAAFHFVRCFVSQHSDCVRYKKSYHISRIFHLFKMKSESEHSTGAWPIKTERQKNESVTDRNKIYYNPDACVYQVFFGRVLKLPQITDPVLSLTHSEATARWPGARIPEEARDVSILYNVHTVSGAHSASYKMGTRVLSQGQATEAWYWINTSIYRGS
jgi:hypothetical protein